MSDSKLNTLLETDTKKLLKSCESNIIRELTNYCYFCYGATSDIFNSEMKEIKFVKAISSRFTQEIKSGTIIPLPNSENIELLDGIEVSSLNKDNVENITLSMVFNGININFEGKIGQKGAPIFRFTDVPLPLFLLKKYDFFVNVRYKSNYDVKRNFITVHYTVLNEEVKDNLKNKIGEDINKINALFDKVLEITLKDLS